jgi:hypothetical protein
MVFPRISHEGEMTTAIASSIVALFDIQVNGIIKAFFSPSPGIAYDSQKHPYPSHMFSFQESLQYSLI